MAHANQKGDKQAVTTEQLILASAEREFLERGFDGARTTSIAKAAGVTHAMLHYYFRSKESLFERIVDGKIEELARSVVEAFSVDGKSFEERLRNGISCHFDFLVENADLPRFFINELVLHPERCEIIEQKRESILKVWSVLQSELDAYAAEHGTQRVDVITLMMDIISLNVFTVMATPIINTVLKVSPTERQPFLDARKQAIIQLVMHRLNNR